MTITINSDNVNRNCSSVINTGLDEIVRICGSQPAVTHAEFAVDNDGPHIVGSGRLDQHGDRVAVAARDGVRRPDPYALSYLWAPVPVIFLAVII